MGALRNYQSEAVQKIMDFYDSEEIKAKLYIGNGLGRNRIAATAIEKIILNDPSCSVMVVFRSITECEQFYSMLTSKAIECSIVLAPAHFVIQKATYFVTQVQVLSRDRHCVLSGRPPF